MNCSRRWFLPALLAGTALLQACGGGEDYWDEYRPRTATVQDLQGQAFVFRDFSYGAVFDPSLATTTTTLSLQAAQADGARQKMPFSISARSASSAGTATLDGASLSLQFTQVDPSLPFTVTKTLVMEVTADMDDGRIQLRNTETGVAQTSAPR